MSVSVYKNNECKYNIDKLEKVVYLINEEALRNIHIDDGEAYITDIDQEPMSLSVYDIELLDADELDERYKFTHTLKFSMNGYVNYRDFEGRYYAIVKTVDGEYWLVNPLFPCKVAYSYTLDSNDSHTDFTLATISNHPTLRIHGMEHATPYECGYRRCTFKSLRLNETIYSLVTSNHVLYTNDGFKAIEYNKNSAVFTETFDGNNVQHKLDFNIKFDDYKDSWHYNLLEFTENRYAAIIETSCDKFVLCGFGFGLQPSFNVTANDDMTMDNILISLVDTHDNGSFVSYQDEITVEKDGTTKWMYTTKYDGYECIGDGIARYLLKEEVDALMNPTGNYMCLVGYEEQFSFLNIVDTFTETQIFNTTECSGGCKLQSSFPLEFIFNNVSCRDYTLISDSDWSISSTAAHITVSPSSGVGGQSYSLEVCNTLQPSENEVISNLVLSYCNKTKNYSVKVKLGDDCLPAGSVFDISANGQYVTIPTACCVKTVTDPSGIITSIIIQNSYVKVYVPQNDTGVVRQFILEFTYCDDKEGEVIINQSNGFEKWVKEDTACTGNQKCDVERKYTGTTAFDINTRTEETRLANCSVSEDCSSVTTRWIDTTGTTCSGGKKYLIQIEQSSNDGGQTWVETGLKRLGDEVEDTYNECAGVETEEEWRQDGYICEDTTKYVRERLYTRVVGTSDWFATETYRRTNTVLESNSADCGYIKGSDEWTCDKWEIEDGYICEETTKYAREQRYVRDCTDCNNCEAEWIATGVYRRTNTVLETNSTDCGYIKGSDEWTCEKWEVVQDDYICEDGTKYTKERRYVRECEDCSDCSTPWVATDAYRRGSTVIEVNSEDCGYIKGSDEWTCDKWETADGYICEETTKYAREQRYVRECEDCNNCEAEWIATGVYRRTNTVLETNSADCGYVKPSTAWTCSKWEVVQNDYICEDGTKYTKERRYVRECEDCSDCSAPWIPTDVYRRGSTVLEENSTDCGYDPTVTGNCTEYRDEGDTICDGFDKYKYLRKYVRECENCNDCSAAWVATNIYKRGTLIQANSVDCGYIPTDTYERWVEDGYMCDGYSKYKRLRKEISEDNIQWYVTSIFKRGDLIENNSSDCGYIPSITGNCTDYRNDGLTICDGYNKYNYLRKYVRECEDCSNCTSTWIATNIYKKGELIQANSLDCGYIPSGTYERWIVDGTICDGYDKYHLETKEISDDNIQWYKTNIHRRGSLIEAKSFDCGYVPTENCYEWRNAGTLCNGFNKYNRLRKYISDDCVRWYETNIYKQGSLIEENSADCGYVPKVEYEYRWVETTNTRCIGTTKYYLYKKQRKRTDIISDWEDVIPTVLSYNGDGTMTPIVAEQESPDCGYVPPVEPIEEWFRMDITTDWICADCDDAQEEMKKIEYRRNVEGESVMSTTCNNNSVLSSNDYNNYDITYAKVGGCVTEIGNSAFYNKTNLSEVLLPSTVTTIGNYAFRGCTSLVDFSLPMSITSIGSYAFDGCIQLNKIMLSNSLTSIGDYAFRGCKNFPSINIPEGVTIIPESCFYDCDGMTDIYIPENVRLIKSKAFANCNGLVNFTCYATEPPAIYQDTFSNMNENLKIYVPAAVVDAYKLAWSTYADKIVAIGE